MKTKKSTRKFIKNKLKSTLESRKKRQTIQKQQAKKQAKRSHEGKIRDNKEDPKLQEDHSLEELSSEEEEHESTEMDPKLLMNESETESDSDGDESIDADDSHSQSEEEEDEDLDPEQAMKLHKKQLMELKEKDPEFFKFLSENDQKLLDFGNDEDDVGDDVDMDDDMEDDEDNENNDEDPSEKDEEDGEMGSEGEEEEEDTDLIALTKQTIMSWQKSLTETSSTRSLRPLLRALRDATHLSSGQTEDTYQAKYRIDPGSTYTTLLFVALRCVPSKFHAGCNFSPDEQLGKTPTLSKKMSPHIKSFLTSLLSLLESSTDPSLVSYTLKSLLQVMPYLIHYPKLQRSFIKLLCAMWGKLPSAKEDEKEQEIKEEMVRIRAFLCLRRLAKCSTVVLEKCLKHALNTFTSLTPHSSTTTLPLLSLMTSGILELLSLDIPVSYRFMFLSLRSISISLRSALTTHSKESSKKVLTWTTRHLLTLHTKFLCMFATSHQELQQLIYPLSTLLCAIVNLSLRSPRATPLSLHLLTLIVQLSSKTKTFIPITSHILHLLQSLKKPKPSTMKPMTLQECIRVPTNYVRTKPHIDSVVASALELTMLYNEYLLTSPSYSELTLPLILSLKRLPTYVLTREWKDLIRKMEETSREVNKLRGGCDVPLSQMGDVEAWFQNARDEMSKKGGFKVEKWVKAWRHVRG